MKTVAIEGLCFAGKSALAQRLLGYLGRHRCTVLDDYSDLVKIGDRPPIPAASDEEELNAFHYYMKVDLARWAPVVSSSAKPDIVIQDRSFHTLLAHVHAIAKDSECSVLRQAGEFIANAADIVCPNAVIYLEVSSDVLEARYRNISHALPQVFTSRIYMQRFKEYFARHFLGSPGSLFFIDANGGIDEIEHEAIRVLKRCHIC